MNKRAIGVRGLSLPKAQAESGIRARGRFHDSARYLKIVIFLVIPLSAPPRPVTSRPK